MEVRWFKFILFAQAQVMRVPAGGFPGVVAVPDVLQIEGIRCVAATAIRLADSRM